MFVTGGPVNTTTSGTTGNQTVAAGVTLASDSPITMTLSGGTLTNAGIWTPHTAPNATHTYAVAYSTIAP